MPDLALLSVIAIVVLALVFDFTNGFHDAANSIATVVSTRVLTPRMAVIWAALFNFIAFLVFQTHVANTVGKIVDPDVVSEAVIFAGLVGAIAWNFITWWLGLPTSSSHALIGGFAGAGVAKAGFGVLDAGSLEKTILWIPLSPLLGMTLGFLLMLASMWIFRRSSPSRVDGLFRRLQLLSAAAFSLGHGGNDAQKTMGIIAALLVGSGYLQLEANGDLPVPLWVVLSAHAAIALGTLTGGWRIVKTLGQRITALKPVGGFSAETAAACSLYLATALGIPVSTTQTITGAIVGVGATRRLSAVRWGVAGRIVWAWVLTIPAAGVIAAVTYAITVSPFAVAALVLAAAAVVAALVAAGRRASRQGIEAGRPAEPAEPVEPAER
ncbi:MAG TPA: inorganic phosphate transporter [Actinomycetota bacterium]|jgi:PiT family inorganic phosphate transporter|nr:inorganic phosphate transporter [Actinomycetota bacterium]